MRRNSMDGLKYNEMQEAYEIKYTLWDKDDITVRLYFEDQQEILDRISDIAIKLDKINRNRKKVTEILIRDGWINKAIIGSATAEDVEKTLYITSASVEADEDGMILSVNIACEKEYLKAEISVELVWDDSLEVVGWLE